MKRLKLTKERQGRFLQALANTGSVTAAIAVAGSSRTRVYELRKADPAFAAAWDEAEEAAVDRLEDEARRPPPRERLVSFQLPALRSAGDAAGAMASITAAVAAGEITPGEAAELSRLVEAYVKAIEASEFDQRLRAIEERNGATRA